MTDNVRFPQILMDREMEKRELFDWMFPDHDWEAIAEEEGTEEPEGFTIPVYTFDDDDAPVRTQYRVYYYGYDIMDWTVLLVQWLPDPTDTPYHGRVAKVGYRVVWQGSSELDHNITDVLHFLSRRMTSGAESDLMPMRPPLVEEYEMWIKQWETCVEYDLDQRLFRKRIYS